MAIDWPSTIGTPREAQGWIEYDELVTTNPFSGATEVVPRWSVWRFVMTWPAQTQREYQALMALLNRGLGSVFSIKVPVYFYRRFVGSSPGTGLTLSGAHTAGTFLVTLSATGLAVGDMIEIAPGSGIPRLHQIIQDSGGGNYAVRPELRKDYADGTLVHTLANKPLLESTMVLPGGQMPSGATFPSGIDDDGQLVRSVSVEFVESLNRNDL